MNLEELLEKKLNERLHQEPELIRKLGAVIQLEIDSQTWHLDPSRKSDFVQAGCHPHPDCSIHISKNDFEKLIRRELNIPLALAFRKIKISGNPLYFGKLKELFS